MQQAAAQGPKTFKILPKKRAERAEKVEWVRPAHWKIPTTLGEEVDQALEEWYGTRGMSVPLEEVGIGRKIDEEERERIRAELGQVEAALAAAEESPAGAKPEFGTPEFWAWARKRKKEKDAERAAKGLPPLPTKKEKEAAKATKAAEAAAKAK